MQLAPLDVESSTRENGEELFITKVGPCGKVYELGFVDLMNLIQARCGAEIKYLDYKPALIPIDLSDKETK